MDQNHPPTVQLYCSCRVLSYSLFLSVVCAGVRTRAGQIGRPKQFWCPIYCFVSFIYLFASLCKIQRQRGTNFRILVYSQSPLETPALRVIIYGPTVSVVLVEDSPNLIFGRRQHCLVAVHLLVATFFSAVFLEDPWFLRRLKARSRSNDRVGSGLTFSSPPPALVFFVFVGGGKVVQPTCSILERLAGEAFSQVQHDFVDLVYTLMEMASSRCAW